MLGVTFLVGFAAARAVRPVFLAILFVAIVATALLARRRLTAVLAPASLLLVALFADQNMQPLAREFMTPLDEGMVMDMPITVPRASVTESVDDLKARNMVLCRFPEVDMVVGKAGRAETPTDPAPMDMIETMVNFRPREFWPRRKLAPADAEIQASAVMRRTDRPRRHQGSRNGGRTRTLVQQSVAAALPLFDVASREYAYHRNQECCATRVASRRRSMNPTEPEETSVLPLWRQHAATLDDELIVRAAPIFTRLVLEQLLDRATIVDPAVVELQRGVCQGSRGGHCGRDAAPSADRVGPPSRGGREAGLEPAPGAATNARRDPGRAGSQLRRRLLLWKVGRDELAAFGGELDLAVQMPGWTNVWTMPIQNRVDMLATGVNTPIGIRVLGRNLDDVDPRLGRGRQGREAAGRRGRRRGRPDPRQALYRDPPRPRARRPARCQGRRGQRPDRDRAGRQGGHRPSEGRERHPVVVRYGRAWREDEESVKNLLVRPTAQRQGPGSPPSKPEPRLIPLSEVADIRVVEGPATIKSENGLLRNYVRVNVRDRDAADLVDEARRAVAARSPASRMASSSSGRASSSTRSARDGP